MQESAELLVTPKLFEQIVKAEGNLIGIESPNVDETLEQFRQLAIRSGQSVYLWDPEAGISAMRGASSLRFQAPARRARFICRACISAFTVAD